MQHEIGAHAIGASPHLLLVDAPFIIDSNDNPVSRTIVIDDDHGHYPIIYANEIGELRSHDEIHGDYPLFKQ